MCLLEYACHKIKTRKTYCNNNNWNYQRRMKYHVLINKLHYFSFLFIQNTPMKQQNNTQTPETVFLAANQMFYLENHFLFLFFSLVQLSQTCHD